MQLQLLQQKYMAQKEEQRSNKQQYKEHLKSMKKSQKYQTKVHFEQVQFINQLQIEMVTLKDNFEHQQQETMGLNDKISMLEDEAEKRANKLNEYVLSGKQSMNKVLEDAIQEQKKNELLIKALKESEQLISSLTKKCNTQS